MVKNLRNGDFFVWFEGEIVESIHFDILIFS